jgi:DnaA-homolog protein
MQFEGSMKQLALDIGLQSLPSLDNFLAERNLAALQHLRLWLGSPRRSPVPTYLWGLGGCGKTHLLQAVQLALREQGVVTAWLDPTLHEPPVFQDEWQVMLMDDVHAYNAVQQHAAFNWFINAQTQQRGLLAAGQLPPADLLLREDLRTRLGWGHVFELHPLSDFECRAALRQEADARGLLLSDEVMDFVLTRFSRDLGSLMQLLQQLDSYALANQRPITIPLIKVMLTEL